MHGLLTKPVGYVAGTKIPLLLRIHGGPNGQDQHSFSVRAPVVRGQRLRRAGGELSRQRRSRREVLERDLSPTGATTRSTICRPMVDHVVKMGVADPDRARRRRLELRRHPHRLHDRQRHALQGGDQRRRHGVHGRLLRHRSVHHSVRLRDRPAVGSEGVGDLPEDLVSVPARRSHQDADAVPRRRARLQRAGAGRAADVSGAAQPRHRHAARDLSEREPRHQRARATCAIATSATSRGTTSTSTARNRRARRKKTSRAQRTPRSNRRQNLESSRARAPRHAPCRRLPWSP